MSGAPELVTITTAEYEGLLDGVAFRQRALSVALKLYETDQLTRLGEHLKASVDPWADRDAEVYGPDMEDER